jgi:ABC-type branched-subunit amino acid transport system substrate-binding protein
MKMNINIEVKIISPEIIAALLALAEALQQIKVSVMDTPKEEIKSEVQAPKDKLEYIEGEIVQEEALKENVNAIGISIVRARLAELIQAGKQEAVRALFNKFGGSTLGEVNEEHYSAIMKEAEKL